MANTSRDPNEVLRDAERKGYSRIVFQQGKPVCDFELTLLGDLSNPQRIAGPYIGSGVPAGSDGFAIGDVDVLRSDFTIKAGRCLVSGSEIVLEENSTYKTQPHLERVRAFPPSRAAVYLRVFRTEITDREDDDLANPDDVATVTAVREKTDWEVVVSGSAINRPDHFLLATIITGGEGAGSVIDRRRKGLTLAALRDEFDALGGSSSSLIDRLNTSLNPDGTIKDNAVGNAQIFKGSVDEKKLAPNAVTETKIADGSVTAGKLAPNAVSGQTIPDGAISRQKLGLTPIVARVTVPAATTTGDVQKVIVPGELVVLLRESEEHSFFLISVVCLGPRLSPGVSSRVQWQQRSLTALTITNRIVHQHQLVLQNFNPATTVTAECQVFMFVDN
ncbi:MAG TPA: hypothetical protein VFR51_10550 [Pyrinomonadaceae bacterium]|nr:hypothetical protein [Pyrinomonadaceae bacterium]